MYVRHYNTLSVAVEKYFLQRFSLIIQYNTYDADVVLECTNIRLLYAGLGKGNGHAPIMTIGHVFYRGPSNL
jgi:hypothetical protein